MEKPWLTESSYEEFFYKGIECVIMRIPKLGYLSGYIGVTSDNKHYKEEFSLSNLVAHGGLTYSGMSLPNDTKCDEKWWVGFDCAHDNDLIPYMCEHTPGYPNLFFVNNNIVYRNFDYVRNELKKLVEQVIL